MKLIKKIAGVLLSASVILTIFMADTGVVWAKDLGNSGEYCEQPLVEMLWGIDAENDKINRMFENWVIGVVWEDGSRDESAQTKYWISGAVAEAFWNASATYMWGDTDRNITGKLQALDEAGDFNDVDASGNSNWRTIGGVDYLTSVKRSDILEIINAMDTVLRPIRAVLNPQVPLADSSNSTVAVCIHNYVETTVQEATAETDAIVTMQCSICGQQKSHFTVPGTAAGQFIKDTVKQLDKAPANGSVTISTDIWTCFDKNVIEALKSRQDVTLTVNFKYKHTDYTFTIPAGYGAEALDALPDGNGYCGFMYLLSVFGGGEVS